MSGDRNRTISINRNIRSATPRDATSLERSTNDLIAQRYIAFKNETMQAHLAGEIASWKTHVCAMISVDTALLVDLESQDNAKAATQVA